MSNPTVEQNVASQIEERRFWMGELAHAQPDDLIARWEALGLTPDYAFLRAPEIGSVMTRGRAGGDGAAFNLGEATVTRCSVRLASGEEGHAYALGRHKRKAEISALCDALMQTESRSVIADRVVAPLAASRAAAAMEVAKKAAATKVDFFTMTRGH